MWGNHRSDNCDQKHKFNQDQIQQKIQEGIQTNVLSRQGNKEDFQNANIVEVQLILNQLVEN